jgi:hypothetical protein
VRINHPAISAALLKTPWQSAPAAAGRHKRWLSAKRHTLSVDPCAAAVPSRAHVIRTDESIGIASMPRVHRWPVSAARIDLAGRRGAEQRFGRVGEGAVNGPTNHV